jgi:hypothetical protein
MVLHSRIQIALFAILVGVSSSIVLRNQSSKGVNVSSSGVARNQSSKEVKTPNDSDKLAALGKGLATIHKLQSLFAKDKTTLADGAEKFANGALSEELSNKDSQVWSTIETMIGETQSAMTSIQGKSKTDREKIMASLEDKLNSKAEVLTNVSNDVTKKQQQQDEEYVLGLLLMHQKDWSMDQQLNATEKFMNGSPLLRDLFEHHDAAKPLAPQLADLMDKKAKSKVTQAVAAEPKKPEDRTKRIAKAASSAAKTLFIQLAASITNRDCPYCVAQCVDKCHSAGKPYVQCLTDCADAGKKL